MVDSVLRTENLRKRFGGLTVTDEVSIDVMPGELHAIIGPNGAGKTTLINQISGLLSSDGGRIWFAGRDITHLPAHLRAALGLARSFQVSSVLSGFSVLENVALAVQARSGRQRLALAPRNGRSTASAGSFPPWRNVASNPAISCPGASSRCWRSDGR